jgi:hypothetical protein
MWEESKHQALAIEFLCIFGNMLQYFLMAKMDAVKSTNRDNSLLIGGKGLYGMEYFQES